MTIAAAVPGNRDVGDGRVSRWPLRYAYSRQTLPVPGARVPTQKPALHAPARARHWQLFAGIRCADPASILLRGGIPRKSPCPRRGPRPKTTASLLAAAESPAIPQASSSRDQKRMPGNILRVSKRGGDNAPGSGRSISLPGCARCCNGSRCAPRLCARPFFSRIPAYRLSNSSHCRSVMENSDSNFDPQYGGPGRQKLAFPLKFEPFGRHP
jgi:hypothetical protein